MRLNRSENTKRNIIVGEIDKVLGVLLPFIVRTLIIHRMGAEYLGLTGLFYSILQMLNLAEVGFGMAITYSMYRPIAENNDKLINALLRYYAKVFRCLALFIGAAGLVIMAFLPHLIESGIPDGINVYVLYLIYLGDACMNCLLFPDRKALLAAYQRDDVYGRVHILTQTVMYFGQIAIIVLSRNFYLYAFTIPASTVAYDLLCSRQAQKLFGQYRREGDLEPQMHRSIRKQVTGLMVRSVASMSRNAFDSLFVSAYLGLWMTAVYGNYYYVMDAVVMIQAVVKTSMAGGVGNSIAMESVEKNRQDMRVINFLFMLISGWCSVCLLCLYQPFMKLWAGSDMTLPVHFAVLFAVYFYLLKMSDIRTLYAESVGLWWESRYLSIAEACANLLMNWLFIRSMGLEGIILATMISYIVFNFIGGAVVLYRYYYIEGGLGAYFLEHGRYFLVSLGVALVTYFVTARITVEGIPGFLMKMIVCLVIPAGLYYLWYRKTKIYKEAMPILKRLLVRN